MSNSVVSTVISLRIDIETGGRSESRFGGGEVKWWSVNCLDCLGAVQEGGAAHHPPASVR